MPIVLGSAWAQAVMHCVLTPFCHSLHDRRCSSGGIRPDGLASRPHRRQPASRVRDPDAGSPAVLYFRYILTTANRELHTKPAV